MDDAEQSTLASASLNGYTNDPLEDFERIGNAAWKSTVIALSHSLREGHPDLVLTVALDSDCDLLAFAKVGFAHSELDPNTGLSVRTFSPPLNRLGGSKGALDRNIRKACISLARSRIPSIPC